MIESENLKKEKRSITEDEMLNESTKRSKMNNNIKLIRDEPVPAG